ncbi:hypothetical protein J2R62_11015 [Plesiomonas shigelloides]|uniref:Uncharacterized protein n=1 Tax=Plesiomonas shigelloides TaxID=703 RepID=A0A8I1W732_PLESH|nr:hypothetical protein [Plesiomonas shigelloides]MBO1108743.1 hypothetical protein [Plesiomonas shigelloides]
MPTLKINWLGACPQCESAAPHNVVTERGSESELYRGDVVTCGKCGHKGVIEVYDESAICEWDSQEDDYLKVGIKGDKLVISIGKETLLHAIEIGRGYGLGDIAIKDKELFLTELVSELQSEKEDGTTLIHEALDQAVINMIENGAESVDWLESDGESDDD